MPQCPQAARICSQAHVSFSVEHISEAPFIFFDFFVFLVLLLCLRGLGEEEVGVCTVFEDEEFSIFCLALAPGIAVVLAFLPLLSLELEE